MLTLQNESNVNNSGLRYRLEYSSHDVSCLEHFSSYLKIRLETDAGDGVVDRLGYIVQVFARQAAHVDAPTLQQVDVEFFNQSLDMLHC